MERQRNLPTGRKLLEASASDSEMMEAMLKSREPLLRAYRDYDEALFITQKIFHIDSLNLTGISMWDEPPCHMCLRVCLSADSSTPINAFFSDTRQSCWLELHPRKPDTQRKHPQQPQS
jgi:hypothetical protein